MNVKSSEANSSNLTGSFVSKCAAQLMREKAELYQAAEWYNPQGCQSLNSAGAQSERFQ